MTRRRLRGLAAILTLATTLGRCAPPPPPPPPVLELQLVGGADQNPDTAGLAAPVAVHVFQLSGMARFERANVFALIEREQQTLGADSLASEELVLAPKEHRTIRRELKHGAQFLAVAVLFRDIDHATWRASAPVAANGLSDLTLTTKGVTATLAPSVGP